MKKLNLFILVVFLSSAINVTKAQLRINALRDSVYVTGPWTVQGPITFENTQPRYTPGIRRYGIQVHSGTLTQIDNPIGILNLNASPILGAHGPGTILEYNGNLNAADGRTFTSAATVNGGVVRFGAQARINLVLAGSYFTRQIWCYGDGTGTIEFDSAFVADHTNLGTVPDGLGSIRLSQCRLLTHSTKSLPKGYRPNSIAGGPKINAHLVFDDRPGSEWVVSTYPQEYVGGLWVQSSNVTVRTNKALTLSGTSAIWSDYTNWGGLMFQKTNSQLNKVGPDTLILSGDQAYADSSRMVVKEGVVRFASKTFDPAFAAIYNPGSLPNAGRNLLLTIDSIGKVEQKVKKAEFKSLKLNSVNATYTLTLGDTVKADSLFAKGTLIINAPFGWRPNLQDVGTKKVFDVQNIFNKFDSIVLPRISAPLYIDDSLLMVNGTFYLGIFASTPASIYSVLSSSPNPSTELTKISLPETSPISEIDIINSTGQVRTLSPSIFDQSTEGELILNRNGLTSGLYRVIIKTKHGNYKSTIIWE